MLGASPYDGLSGWSRLSPWGVYGWDEAMEALSE
jgi:hypothetical protein